MTTAARISGRYKPEGEWPPPSPEEVPDEAADVEASGLFENVQIRRYLWEKTYTAEGYIALLDTLSNHIAMEAPKREHLYREIRRRIVHRPDQRVRRHRYARHPSRGAPCLGFAVRISGGSSILGNAGDAKTRAEERSVRR